MKKLLPPLSAMLLVSFSCSKSNTPSQGTDAAAAKPPVINNLATKATVAISAETGGYVNVGNIQLVIPQGALAQDTDITAEVTETAESLPGTQKLGKGVKLSPEGLQFLTPADLTVCYDAAAASAVVEKSAMIYYKEESGQLVGIAGRVNAATHCVQSHIEHFSEYVAAAASPVQPNTAPTITDANFLPTTPLAGIPLRVRTQINDLNGGSVTGQVVSAFLYYRSVGEATYKKVALTPDTTDETETNRYFFLIPADQVTTAGIQYYFEATDALNATKTTTAKSRNNLAEAQGIRYNLTALEIGAGFTRGITLQATANLQAGPWQNISMENQTLSNTNLGTLTRTGPSTIRLSTTGSGTGTISSTAGFFSTNLNLKVVPGLLTRIEIADSNQVHLTGTYAIATNQILDLSVVGFDAFGNASVINPDFSTSGGIGSATTDGTVVHFTASTQATTGTLTATMAGLSDSLNFFVYIPPTVVATAPYGGAAGINYVNPTFAVTFSKVMDTTSLTSGTDSACSGSLQVSKDNFVTCVAMTSATPQFFASNMLAVMTAAAPIEGSATYQIRVLATARDTSGYPMVATYSTPVGFTTIPDVTSPAAGSPIVASVVNNSQLSLSWGAASDDSTTPANLQYKIVKDDNSANNLNSVAKADAKAGSDLLQDWTPNLTSNIITGLATTGTYYFAVLVRDAAGNKALYAPVSASLTFPWGQTITAGNCGGVFSATTVDSMNNVFAVGQHEGTESCTYGNGVTLTSSNNGSNGLIVKYSSSGNILWAKIPTNQPASSIFVATTHDNNGNAYAVGYQLGNGAYAYDAGITVSGGSTSYNMVIVKYNADGVAQWARSTSAGSVGTNAKLVETDSYGNVFVVVTAATPIGVLKIGSGTYPARQYTLIKFDSDGNVQWVKSPIVPAITQMKLDSAGNIYFLGGMSPGTLLFGSGISVTATANSGLLVKSDNQGNILWAKAPLVGSVASIYARLAISTSGDLYVAGWQPSGIVTFAPGITSNNPLTYGSGQSALLVKFDASGNAAWARSIAAGNNYSNFADVATDGNGNVYVSGTIIGNSSIDFGSGITALGATPGYNGLVIRYDSNGTPNWIRYAQLGTSTESNFQAMAIDSAGSILVVGNQYGQQSVSYDTGLSLAGTSTASYPIALKFVP